MDGHHQFRDVHMRDEVLAKLMGFAQSRPTELASAARKLNLRLEETVEVQRENARRCVRRRLVLLEIARRRVLDDLAGPHQFHEPSDLRTDGPLPPGFDPCCLGVHGPIPRWMKECYDLAGEFDHNWVSDFPTYLGYAHNLRNGTFGDWKFPRPVDLRQVTPAQMWMLHETRPISKQGEVTRPHNTRARAEVDVDVDAAAAFHEDYVAALSNIAYDLFDSVKSPITTDGAWEIVLVALLIMAPNFDPSGAGIVGMPPWELGETGRWWRARCCILLLWQDHRSNLEILCEIAFRALRTIDPGCIAVQVAPLTEDEFADLLRRVISRGEFTAKIKSLAQANVPPAAWTRKQLAILARVSDKTIGRIRLKTALPKLKPSQRDAIYMLPEVEELARTARRLAAGKREWINVADCLDGLLEEHK